MPIRFITVINAINKHYKLLLTLELELNEVSFLFNTNLKL